MEEIINQIIENRNYHILSDEQVEAIEQLLKENRVLTDWFDYKEKNLKK